MSRRGLTVSALAIICLVGCADDGVLVELDPTFAVSRAEVVTAAPLGTGPVTELVRIVNGTDGRLQGLTATVEYPGGGGQWLTATFDQTTATREDPATLRLQADPDDLGLGAFAAVVLLRADGASNSPFRIRVTLTVEPRPPARVELLTPLPAQVANGAPLGSATVRLLNSVGEPTPVSGVVIEASLTGGGSLSGTQTVTTGPDGRATFADLSITGQVGDKAVVFGSSSLTPATAALRLVAGPASNLVAGSTLTQTAPAGGLAAEPPAVRAEDQSGNPVAGVTVTFSAGAGAAIVPTAPVVTGTDGIARLISWQLRPSAGQNTVVAAAAGLAGSPITFTANGETGPPVALAKVSGDHLIGLAGATLGTPHVARVTDAAGNGVQGVTVSWVVSGGGSVTPTSSVSDAEGLVQAVRTLGAALGPAGTTATAVLGGGPVSVTFAVSAAAAGPAKIVKVSGDAQAGPAGAVLQEPLAVRVLDAADQPVAAVTVNWSTTNIGGSFPSGATSQTDVTGLAVATWRLGTTVGPQTAQAAVGGPAPAVFTATAQAAVSGVLSTVTVTPSRIAAGSGVATIAVTARDPGGNPVSGATVVLAVTGSGSLTQPPAPTNASGVATGAFTSTVAGAKVVSATVAGIALSQTAAITVAAGAPATLTPVTATAFDVRFNRSVSPSPAVQVADAFGNTVPAAAVTFTRGQGAGLLNGSGAPVVVSADASGVATVGWFVQGITGATLGAISAYNQVQASIAGATASTFTGTIDLRYNSSASPGMDGVASLVSNACFASGCHPGAGDLSYSMLVSSASPSTRFVAAGDTATITSSYNRLLAKIRGVVGHGGGTFPTRIVTLFAAWIKQGARQN